jgi:hypothetical protein
MTKAFSVVTNKKDAKTILRSVYCLGMIKPKDNAKSPAKGFLFTNKI